MVSKKIKILNAISFSIVLIYSIFLFENYTNISKEIVTHINIRGEADAFGDKVHLIYAIVANCIILLLILFFIYKPQYANYPVEINNENKGILYEKMRFFLSIISIMTSTIFSYMIFSALDLESKKLFYWMIAYAIITPLITISYFKNKEKNNCNISSRG